MSTLPEANVQSGDFGTEYTECIGEDRAYVRSQLRGNEVWDKKCKCGHTRMLVDGKLMCITTDAPGRATRCVKYVSGIKARTNHH